MTEREKICQKLLDGTRYFFDPNNSPLIKDIKKEFADNEAFKKAMKEKIKQDLKGMLALGAVIYGTFFILCATGEIALLFKEDEKPKIEEINKADKNLEKFEIPFKKLNAQDLFLEHYFFPKTEKKENFLVTKKEPSVVDPVITLRKQKTME